MAEPLITVAVTMPAGLATAMLEAAGHSGQRTGETAMRLDHFVIVSERTFERLLNGVQTTLGRAVEERW